jgi:hypothetical protein
MGTVARLLCLVPIGVGATGLLAPDAFLEIARYSGTPPGLHVAAFLRILLGGALILAAEGSRAPKTLSVIGATLMVAALITPLFGFGPARLVLDWSEGGGQVVLRAVGVFAIAFGGMLCYLLSRKAPAAWESSRGRTSGTESA